MTKDSKRILVHRRGLLVNSTASHSPREAGINLMLSLPAFWNPREILKESCWSVHVLGCHFYATIVSLPGVPYKLSE